MGLLKCFSTYYRQYVHLTPSEFEDYLLGSLLPDQLAVVERHLAICPRCSEDVQLVRDVLPTSAYTAPPTHGIVPPTSEVGHHKRPPITETKLQPANSNAGLSRRRFVTVGAAFSFSAGPVIQQLVASATPFITRRSVAAGRRLNEWATPTAQRIEFLTQLLRPSGTVVGVAGGSVVCTDDTERHKWTAWMAIGYPHDRAALDAYSLFANNLQILETEQLCELSNDVSLVTTGSPAANQLSQLYIPYHRQDDGGKAVSRTFVANCIPYHYVFLKEKRLRLVPGEGRQLALAPHKGLLSNGMSVLADTSGDGAMLKKDFLLISRLPRSHGGSADVITAGGGYGPGTSALRLLFNKREFPDEEVRELERVLGDARYFQVAFVCDIADDGNACNLRVWDKCPPIRLEAEELERRVATDNEVEQGAELLPQWAAQPTITT